MALQKLIAKKWKEVYNLMAVSHLRYLLMKGFLCCIMSGICVFNKPVINLNQWKEIKGEDVPALLFMKHNASKVLENN